MEGKERKRIGKGGACLCWDGSPQGCLHWGTPTLVPSLTILSAPWMVEHPPCWPRAKEISRWISSDLHKDWPPATNPGQTPRPGCDLGLSTRARVTHRCPEGWAPCIRVCMFVHVSMLG